MPKKKKDLNHINTFREEATYFYNRLRHEIGSVPARNYLSEKLDKQIDIQNYSKEECNLVIHFCHIK